MSWVGGPPFRLSADHLIDQARRKTGLDDFGPDDPLEGTTVLVDSLQRDARLSPVGRIVARGHIGQLLANRLRLEDARRRTPAIASEQVQAPLIITGLPRSGSSLLHGLLAADPAHRSPLAWETMLPCLTGERRPNGPDPRIAEAERRIRWFGRLAPDFRAIHNVGAQLPQECIDITGHAFMSMVFETMYRVPTYREWLDRQDMGAAYRVHRRFLQHLQAATPTTRWVLKAPAHLDHLDALVETYPDARIILTHREPLEVLPSVASLLTTLRRAFSPRVDHAAVGREVVDRWWNILQSAETVRRRGVIADDRIVDVQYEDLVEHPLGVIEGVYDWFGLELTDDVRRRMADYLRRFDRSRRPRHAYTLEMFDIDRDDADRRFENYREQHGLDAARRRNRMPARLPVGIPA